MDCSSNLLTLFVIFQLPEYIWSEEYQKEVLSKHFEAFDQLRNEGFFIGEFIWNFADFRTAQSKQKYREEKKTIKAIN